MDIYDTESLTCVFIVATVRVDLFIHGAALLECVSNKSKIQIVMSYSKMVVKLPPFLHNTESFWH